jgi:polysaccharide deacetylase 2 family uncharacterized protein YibQ
MARKRHEGRLIAALALTAVLLFTAGEAVLFFRSESGGLVLARQGLPFPRAQVSETLTFTVQSTLRRIGVPGSAQSREAAKVEGQSVTRLTLRLPPRASLFRINSAVTGAVEQRGGRVFDAWEEPEAEGGERVTLWLGVGKALTHEVVLLRSGGGGEEEAVRLGLVIEGFAAEDSDSLGLAAMRLPFAFTAAVLANGHRSRSWSDALARSGRDVVAHLPMEPLHYPSRNPGPDAILVDMTHDQIRRLVKKHLRAVPDAIACLPYMGAMALQDPDAMKAVSGELKASRMAYLELAGEARSVGLDAAAAAGVPFLRLDGRFEPGPARDARAVQAARERLREFADTARRRGYATIVVHLDAASLAALRREIPKLETQGVRTVPLSALLRPSVL